MSSRNQRAKQVNFAQRGFNDPNRLRDHLVAFFSHYNPRALKSNMKVYEFIRLAERKGLDTLNKRLKMKYSDEINIHSKLGSATERVLRLCNSLTPDLLQPLLNRAYSFSDKEDDQLLKDLYIFCLEHDKRMLQKLHILVSFAQKQGKEALNSKLIKTYGTGLSPVSAAKETTTTPMRNRPIDQLNSPGYATGSVRSLRSRFESVESNTHSNHSRRKVDEGVLGVSRRDPLFLGDETLRPDVKIFMERYDKDKLTAENALYVWVDLMGRTRTVNLFRRLYGEELKMFTMKQNARKASALLANMFDTDTESSDDNSSINEKPIIISPKQKKKSYFESVKRKLSISSSMSGVSASRKPNEEKSSLITRRLKHSKGEDSSSRSPRPGRRRRRVRGKKDSISNSGKASSVPDNSDGFADQRRSSYLDSAALFMRNIPNVSLSTSMYAQKPHYALDYDDDTLDRHKRDKAKQTADIDVDFDQLFLEGEKEKVSPLQKLKYGDPNDSSMGSFFTTASQSAQESPTKNTGMVKKVFKTFRMKKSPKKKIKNNVFDSFPLQAVEEAAAARPENAEFNSMRAPRPEFQSGVPEEFKTFEQRRNFLRGDDGSKQTSPPRGPSVDPRRGMQPNLPIKPFKLNLPLNSPPRAEKDNVSLGGADSPRVTMTPASNPHMSPVPQTTSKSKRTPGGGLRKLFAMPAGMTKQKKTKMCRRYVECTDVFADNFGNCESCGLKRELHRGESFEESLFDESTEACRRFLGKTNFCITCGCERIEHQWFAFDVPKALLPKKKG